MKIILIILLSLSSGLFARSGEERVVPASVPAAGEYYAVNGQRLTTPMNSLPYQAAHRHKKEGAPVARPVENGPEQLMSPEFLALLGLIAVLGMMHTRQTG